MSREQQRCLTFPIHSSWNWKIKEWFVLIRRLCHGRLLGLALRTKVLQYLIKTLENKKFTWKRILSTHIIGYINLSPEIHGTDELHRRKSMSMMNNLVRWNKKYHSDNLRCTPDFRIRIFGDVVSREVDSSIVSGIKLKQPNILAKVSKMDLSWSMIDRVLRGNQFRENIPFLEYSTTAVRTYFPISET
jgi:hypothetical protein